MYLENDETGVVSVFANYQLGWSPASPEDPPVSQEKIDAYKLVVEKKARGLELQVKFYEWVAAGFLYAESRFDLSANGIENVRLKNALPLTTPNRFKYFALPDEQGIEVQHDFEDETGWDGFYEGIIVERDRIMVYKNSKKTEINAASTPAAVAAVVINFSP